MSEVTMTPMRQSAISILSQIPEEQLTVVIQFMLNIDAQKRREQQNRQENGKKSPDRRPGIAKGKFVCPDDIDEDNELIAQWFEGTV